MDNVQKKITICIPHWQVKRYIRLCLRSIRRHSRKYNLEVIVVDNGSRDESLDYLRSLKWIRLVERPEETHANWPKNVFTAWDVGILQATGEFFITMHSDVFIKSDDWLDPFLSKFGNDTSIAGAGAWKLDLENPLYAFQKRAIGYATGKLKVLFGRKKNVEGKQGHYPRDYCAMYRSDVILKHNLNISDTRESPALDILGLLREKGAVVSYYDPHVASIEHEGWGMHSVESLEAEARRADCVVIVTDHASVDYAALGGWAQLIFDTRNAMSGVVSPTARVVKL